MNSKPRDRPKADSHPVKERTSVKYKGKHECSRPQNFTPLWELQLQEPVETEEEGEGDQCHLSVINSHYSASSLLKKRKLGKQSEQISTSITLKREVCKTKDSPEVIIITPSECPSTDPQTKNSSYKMMIWQY